MAIIYAILFPFFYTFLLLFNHVGPSFLLFFTRGAIQERACHEAVDPLLSNLTSLLFMQYISQYMWHVYC